MPQMAEPANLPPTPFNSTESVFNNSTLRQTIRLTQPAKEIRLRLSNAFGLTDLDITGVTVSLTADQKLGSGAIQRGTTKKVLFDGSRGTTIPNGALAVSDPISVPKGGTTLAVDIYLQNGQQGGAITSHPGSRTTSWMSFGDWTGVTNMTDPTVASVAHWYFISSVEALLPRTARSCVLVGDSITDGRGSDTDANNRWPDRLQKRLRQDPSTAQLSLLNQAAGGNRILADGLGPNVLSRLDRDVLGHSGVQCAVLFEGVNDIGVAPTDPATQEALGTHLITAYRQITTRLHAAGIPVIGATITPFSAPAEDADTQPYSDPERELTRQRVNAWIRDSGAFDAVVDFDEMVRDPKAPERLLGKFDSGDYLHLNGVGYQAMADGFPIGVFEKVIR
ncbi:putative extracellular GDSL-like lipase/acylhydrolase [Aspergillus campestris IBT 28561]|uniref:Extracellular GDSL-like lipase/acylhydrolase n=1 Tax=Aspergillus campestris (strain IBT 28561) TaxID=1392248 RepID=A0A2I1D5L0_ASPC2|nr:putative extracellular GDSL-like lipase/acylhydrolase [Aspergillus campestris IBT 28561]PKY05161.1 putative extracellular GDSL-like lipase/acylhydrolase [Aspergillus campestris IBT 28561]